MSSILLVDDDMNLLRGFLRTLRRGPFEVFTANSAEMAIEMFQRQSFELVVVDQRMPGKPGGVLLNWIAKHFSETVRIMLTGHADIELMQQLINEAKVFRVLTKPCHEPELIAAIRDGLALRGQSPSLRPK